MPRHVSDRWLDFLGPGALASFALASSAAVLGLGVPIVWRLREVVRTARQDGRRPADAIVCLGRHLVRDQPTAVYRARLDHAADLLAEGIAPRVVLTGGLTADSTRTEAAAGREYLLARGAPAAAILCEDASRHTLENLFHAREALRAEGLGRVVVVSDGLHLARALTYARGFGLDATGSPAPYPGSRLARAGRALREAFFVHWYHVGVLYSRAIRSRRLLERVT